MNTQTMVSKSVKDLFDIKEAPVSLKIDVFTDKNNPYIPDATTGYVFRREFIREMMAFLKKNGGDALYITGPTGSGKTSGVTETAARLNWPVQQLTAHGRMEFQADLVGHHALIASSPGQPPVMQFMYGPLSIAMKEGHILLINEVDLVDPSELSGLNDVLEGRPLIIAQNGGEIIKPHPKFRVVVTGNSAGSGDQTGLYQGVMMQNLAAMDRYRFTCVHYPEEQVEIKIIEGATPGLPATLRPLMVRVANEVRRLFLGESGDGSDGQLSITLSTRTLVRWADLSTQFRGAENALEYSLDHALLRRASTTDREVILRLAKDIFGDQWV